MEDYEKECEKRKARAEKFGTTYVAPKLEDFLPWSEAKRIKEQPKKGFATGIDMMDSEEVNKREARKARFAAAAKEEKANEDDKNEESEEPAKEQEEKDAGEESMETEKKVKKSKGPLPVTQAWDKEEMLREQRSDPPVSLWLQPTPPPQKKVSEEPKTSEESEPATEEKTENVESEKTEAETTTEEKTDAAMADDETPADTTPATWVPEKVHLFAIDWAAFKQIRNKDILTFFTGYGPTYVEWLADLSCNVHFEDKYTAGRALMNLSQEIPSPPPEEVVAKSESTCPDFGNMTWRFCLRPLRKVANDRYGRKGTTARVLMRLGMSTDMLQDRPNSWPAPPGGFSKTKVLGPHSDFKPSKNKKKREKKQKRARGEMNGGSDATNSTKKKGDAYITHDGEGEHPMLARGLSAGRQGFSTEDLEQERASKRQKSSADVEPPAADEAS